MMMMMMRPAISGITTTASRTIRQHYSILSSSAAAAAAASMRSVSHNNNNSSRSSIGRIHQTPLSSLQYQHQQTSVNTVRAYSTEQSESTSTASSSSSSYQKKLNTVLRHNSRGRVYEAVQAYEQLKREHLYEISLNDYNKILASFAPKKLMFKWFQPYKDFVDMYYETGKYRPDERMDEAMAVFKDISASPLGLHPDTVSYNSLMKVQLSAGPRNVLNVFRTFNEMQHTSLTHKTLQPNVATFTTLLRACAMLERVDLAEEIYEYALTKELRESGLSAGADNSGLGSESESIYGDSLTPGHVGIHFYNTMLDVYAESRHKNLFPFFEQMVHKNLALNGNTFNTYAKGCIFMDERERLVDIVEVMRVEGVMQRELAEPIRNEITEAYRDHTKEHYPYSKSFRFYLDNEKRLKDDLLGPIIQTPSWGRMVDVRDLNFLEMIKPYMDKYIIDADKVHQLYVADDMTRKMQEELAFVENYQLSEDEKPKEPPSSKWAIEWLNY